MFGPHRRRSGAGARGEDDFPWWLVATVAIGCWLAWRIAASELYSEIARVLVRGVGITAFVTFTAFALAALLGLALAVAALSHLLWLRQLARFWIEILRGIPMLVLLLYIAFVGVPLFVEAWNAAVVSWADSFGLRPMRTRDVPFVWRAIIALTLGYSAFIAEVFRAGILAVGTGQVEAAKALGLGPWRRFRHVVMPQALRIILPPLGNDFIAMIKDSSLVSVLGVADVTQMGKVYASGSFRFMETYNVVACVYLFVTLLLSLALRRLERSMQTRHGG